MWNNKQACEIIKKLLWIYFLQTNNLNVEFDNVLRFFYTELIIALHVQFCVLFSDQILFASISLILKNMYD